MCSSDLVCLEGVSLHWDISTLSCLVKQEVRKCLLLPQDKKPPAVVYSANSKTLDVCVCEREMVGRVGGQAKHSFPEH